MFPKKQLGRTWPSLLQAMSAGAEGLGAFTWLALGEWGMCGWLLACSSAGACLVLGFLSMWASTWLIWLPYFIWLNFNITVFLSPCLPPYPGHLFSVTLLYPQPWPHNRYSCFRVASPLAFMNTLPGASLVAQIIKCLSAMQETWVRSVGWEDPLEKKMAARSSILAWKIPCSVEPGRLPSMGLQRVGHDWAASLSLSPFWGLIWLILFLNFCSSWHHSWLSQSIVLVGFVSWGPLSAFTCWKLVWSHHSWFYETEI